MWDIVYMTGTIKKYNTRSIVADDISSIMK